MHRRPRALVGLVALVVALVALAPGLLTPTTASAGINDLDAEEIAALERLNALRADLGLPVLKVSPTLTAAAEWMANDLSERDLLDHTDSLGRGIRDRLNAFGYPSNSIIRENLGAGYETGASVMQGWQDSPGHRANNEADDVVAVGIARVYREGTQYGWFWALNLGSVEDSGSTSLSELLAPEIVGDPPLGTEPGTFTLGFPRVGVGMTQWNGGSLQELEDGARQGGARAVYVTHDGRFVRYSLDAPDFVNAAFVALFPGGDVPRGTLLLIVV